MNKHKSGTRKKSGQQINKKQLVMMICLSFCLGLVLIAIGIFKLIHSNLPPADSSIPNEGTSELSISTFPSAVETATPTTTAVYPSKTSGPAVTSTTAAAGTNKLFENIASLSGTCLGWGQGTTFDQLNRPVYALTNQKKYAEYGADFIKLESRKVLYLTFDEGYENGYSAKILDVLKEKNVRAVFFVTEPYAKSNSALVKRMIAEGHIVGNHSVTHPSAGLPSQTLEDQTKEIMGCHDYVQKNFHYTMSLFRFPSGKYSVQSLALVHNCGYRSVFWSFAYLDYDVNQQMEKTKALNLLTTRLHPGAIYLLHAVSKTNTEILGDFIDKARTQGYVIAAYQ